MTMKQISIGILFLFGMLQTQAQETKTIWQKDIPSSTQDFLTTMTSTIDRQILLSGSSINQKAQQVATGNQQPNKGYDYHIIKLDQQGNKLWDQYFGGTRHDYLMSSIATQEGGFLLMGTSFSNQSGDKKENNLGGSDVWIVRLNENGEELWQKTLGTTNNDEASAAIQSTDEGFFVAGNINSNQNLFGSKDLFISKLNKDGKLINTTLLGGKGLDEVQETIATKDGGALMMAYSTSGKTENKTLKTLETKTQHSENKAIEILSSLKASTNAKNSSTDNSQSSTIFGKSEDGFGAGDYWIIKLDKNAHIEWQKTYGGNEDDRPKTIALTEKGYLIGGESRSNSSGNKRENTKEGTDLWLISLDDKGNEIWQKNYSFGNRDVLMSTNVIRKTNKDNFSEDRGFLLGGYTQAEGKTASDDEKFWMLYIDVNGKEEWRKHVEGKSKKKEERLVSAKLQSDGTFLLAGTSAEELGQENWKILKLGDQDLDNLIEKKDIRIYPNPVEDYCYVEIGFPMQYNEEAQIFLHDMSGRQMQTIKTKNRVTKINTAGLPQGVYVVSATTNNKTVNNKIVKK
jgi:hypothetical protein